MLLSFARPEHLADQVCVPDGHVQQAVFARGQKVGHRRFIQVSAVIEFVAVDFLPAAFAPPTRETLATVGDAGGQVTVRFLSRRYQCDDAVQVGVQSLVVFHRQRIGSTLYDFIGVGVVEREISPMLSLHQPARNGEVVKASVLLAFLEC